MLTTPNADEDTEQEKFPFTVGGTAEEYSHFGRKFGSFLQK